MVYKLVDYDVEDYIHFIVGFHIILFLGVYLFTGIIIVMRKIYYDLIKN